MDILSHGVSQSIVYCLTHSDMWSGSSLLKFSRLVAKACQSHYFGAEKQFGDYFPAHTYIFKEVTKRLKKVEDVDDVFSLEYLGLSYFSLKYNLEQISHLSLKYNCKSGNG